MKKSSMRIRFFVPAFVVLATAMGIAPISCGDKQAQSGSSSNTGTGNGNNGGNGGGSCQNHELLGDATGNETMDFLSDAYPVAQQFTLSASETISEVDISMNNAASNTGTVKLSIEADSSGAPSGAPIGTDPAATYDIASIGGGNSNVAFVLGTPLSLGAGTYWIVLHTTGITGGNNVPVWADNTQPGFRYSTDGGASWSTLGTNSMEFQIQGCP